MKNLLIGIMIVAASVVNAQEATPSLKDHKTIKTHRDIAKKSVLKHDTERNVSANDNGTLESGAVRIINGKAIIILFGDEKHNMLYPVNLADELKVDGRIIQFRMRDSRAQIPAGVKAYKAIAIEDVVVVPVKK